MTLSTIISVINVIRKNVKLILLSITVLLVFTIGILLNKLKQKDTEIGRLTNNTEYYQQLINGKFKENRVLQLTIDDMNHAKDSVIQELNTVRKQLKIKSNKVQSAQVIKTVIKDSITTVVKSCEFNEELKLNPLTTVLVSKKDSLLKVTIDIQNAQTLFIEQKKVYRRKYKNFVSRLIHFDFKKDRINKYTIHNSNELIKVTDTRIIEIK